MQDIHIVQKAFLYIFLLNCILHDTLCQLEHKHMALALNAIPWQRWSLWIMLECLIQFYLPDMCICNVDYNIETIQMHYCNTNERICRKLVKRLVSSMEHKSWPCKFLKLSHVLVGRLWNHAPPCTFMNIDINHGVRRKIAYITCHCWWSLMQSCVSMHKTSIHKIEIELFHVHNLICAIWLFSFLWSGVLSLDSWYRPS